MARYDLVSDWSGRLLRIQVKSATLAKRGSYICCLSHGCSHTVTYSRKDCDFLILYAPYRHDFPDLFADGYYIIPVEVASNHRNATLFPPMKGRGNIKICRWEEYRDGWERLQK